MLHRQKLSKRNSSPTGGAYIEKDEWQYENIMYDAKDNTTDGEIYKQEKYIDVEEKVTLKKYLCCGEIWKGLGLMFFYQFAGYNVVSFYATSILKHPRRTEKEFLHPNKTKNLPMPTDNWKSIER